MFIKRLKDLREDNNYTQEFIAKKTYMKQPQYARYESGKRDIPLDTLIILSKLYNTSTDYILGLTNKKEPYPEE